MMISFLWNVFVSSNGEKRLYYGDSALDRVPRLPTKASGRAQLAQCVVHDRRRLGTDSPHSVGLGGSGVLSTNEVQCVV